MTGQVIIGSSDITNLIVDGSYQMDAVESFESWLDGNKMEHRSGIVEKVKGSFNVVLAPQNNQTLAGFKQIMTNATTDGVTYATVYVTNKGAVEAIDCFYALTNEEHILTTNGFIDVVKVEIQER